MDQNIKQQIVETINGTTNVLVTVSSNPTVDELAACIGLTLVLNKLGKHATAVFSGKVPSTLEFLKPGDTLETNTDSLRDFIIALDKSKADKLRYKVEDDVVKIFITPYKTSISQKDLEFSQGDFNVDAVIALGVHTREELDKTIVAHGRILHDATVICVNHDQVSNLGVYNWQDAEASSLCEMVVDLAETIQPDNFDAQTATALLTGIVAETQRFSNEKTSARTMSLSAKLMAAGANQQLVASKLQTNLDKEQVAMPDEENEEENGEGGMLRIDHNGNGNNGSEVSSKKLDDEAEEEEPEAPDESVTEEPLEEPLAPRQEKRLEPTMPPQPSERSVTQPIAPQQPLQSSEAPATPIKDVKPDTGEQPLGTDGVTADEPSVKPSDSVNSRLTFEPPQMGGTLTANAQPQGLEPSTDGLSLPTPVGAPILNHEPTKLGQNQGNALSDPLDTSQPIIDQETITHIEKSVGSDHVVPDTSAATTPPMPGADLDALSNAAKEAAGEGDQNKLDPLAAAGASPLDMDVQHHNAPTPNAPPEPVLPPAPQAPSPGMPSASDILATTAQTDTPLEPPAGQSAPAPDTPNLPSQLGVMDQSLPAEQTASSTSQPLPPPVPPPIPPGAFPAPGQPNQQAQQSLYPPAQPQ